MLHITLIQIHVSVRVSHTSVHLISITMKKLAVVAVINI